MKHPVSGTIRKVTEVEFLDMFDVSVQNAIMASAARYRDCEALVCFENLQMDSSQLGARTALVVGPNNTLKLAQLEDGGTRLGDCPSRFQYPVAYVDYRTGAPHEA